MTAPYRKKLIEVALPLKAINEASAREKSIRHGHPSTLHLWWARRPLAACRAVLFTSLVDDPDSDPAYRKADGTVDEDRAGLKRAQLFNLIEELVLWENSNNPRVIDAARAEIARCVASRKIELAELKKDMIVFGDKMGQAHPKGPVSGDGVTAWEIVLMQARPEVVNAFLAEHAPPVLDPFCGGGSIPLEAQRLGLRAYGSDLNPVPVLITKALIEIPPKFAGQPPVNPEWQAKTAQQKAIVRWQGAQGLADDVRYYGQWMRDAAARLIERLYPKVEVTPELAATHTGLRNSIGTELEVVAWIWARDVISPNPACKGARVPLVRSFWLSTKAGKKAYAKPVVAPGTNSYEFSVGSGDPPATFDPKNGTVSRLGGTCLLSGDPIPFEYIRAEGRAGRIGYRLMAIVAETTKERLFLSPLLEHEQAACISAPKDAPQTNLPVEALGFRVQNYGLTKHCDLFTPRQLVALTTFTRLVQEVHESLRQSGADAGYANAVATYLALAVSRSTSMNSALCWWNQAGFISQTFTRNALSMIWDFAECNILGNATGNWLGAVAWIQRSLEQLPAEGLGVVNQIDARSVKSAQTVFSTDPPYYDNVPYADMSDFFYVWLRACLQKVYPDLFGTMLVPKEQELIAEPFRHGGREQAAEFFESGIRQVFDRILGSQDSEFPATIYYAFKQSEEESTEETGDGSENSSVRVSTGWETFLQGIIDTGWSVEGTWPIRTERPGGVRNLGRNSLASSIVLVCRGRSNQARTSTRREFMSLLRAELPEALRNLQRGNIAPVDLAQAAIGPGMSVFSKYTRVIESDGTVMTVRTALGIINQVLDEVLAEQDGDFDSDTRWALAWFEQFGTGEGPYGVAETLSKAKNTSVQGLVEAGVVRARSGKVQLIRRDDLPEIWDPTLDKRLTIWESTQHLLRELDSNGESGAAALISKLGSSAELSRDLAYRLYTICEKNKWSEEAAFFNALVIAWPELATLSRTENRADDTQGTLF